MPQVALAWLAARPAVTSVILGARTTDQLHDDLRVSTWASTRTTSRGWTR
jgi:aryl-alcohol dehydrogenase-like predicted oxidoreductase